MWSFFQAFFRKMGRGAGIDERYRGGEVKIDAVFCGEDGGFVVGKDWGLFGEWLLISLERRR